MKSNRVSAARNAFGFIDISGDVEGYLPSARNRASLPVSCREQAMLKLSPDRQPTNAVIVVMGDEPEVRLWCDEKDKMLDLVRLGVRVKMALKAGELPSART
jgi:hypothetical protein